MLTFEENTEKLMKLLDEKIKDNVNRQLFDSLKEKTNINQSISMFFFKNAVMIVTSLNFCYLSVINLITYVIIFLYYKY